MSDNVRSDVGVTDDAHPVVLLTESSESDPWLLATEHQVRVVLRHHNNFSTVNLRTVPFSRDAN